MTTEKASPGVPPVVQGSSSTGLVPKPQSSDRVAALDWFKGFLMLVIIYVHLGAYWGDGTWTSAWSFVWMVMDWGGPVGFISFTIVGTMISLKKRMAAGKTRDLGTDSFKKFMYLFVIGEIMNIIVDARNPVHLGPWHLLGMNMITAVAFAQLFVYPIMKMAQKQRILLAISMIVAFPILFAAIIQPLNPNPSEIFWVDETSLTSVPAILYFLLFHMASMMPTYGWLVLTPVVVIVFDSVLTWFIRGGPSTAQPSVPSAGGWKGLRANPVSWLIVKGVAIVVVSILAGGFVLSTGFAGASGTYLNITNPDPFRFWSLPGIPLFLLRFSPQYIGFGLGIVTIVFGLSFRLRDRRRNISRPPTRVEIFGQYSFSVFVYHHVFYLIPLKIPVLGFIAVLFPVLMILLFAIQVWNDKAGGILSLEWGMKKYLAFIEWAKKKHEARERSTEATRPTHM